MIRMYTLRHPETRRRWTIITLVVLAPLALAVALVVGSWRLLRLVTPVGTAGRDWARRRCCADAKHVYTGTTSPGERPGTETGETP